MELEHNIYGGRKRLSWRGRRGRDERNRRDEQGRRRRTEKLQAHYVQGEWRVGYFATLVIMCVMQKANFVGVSRAVLKCLYVCRSARVTMCGENWD